MRRRLFGDDGGADISFDTIESDGEQDSMTSDSDIEPSQDREENTNDPRIQPHADDQIEDINDKGTTVEIYSDLLRIKTIPVNIVYNQHVGSLFFVGRKAYIV